MLLCYLEQPKAEYVCFLVPNLYNHEGGSKRQAVSALFLHGQGRKCFLQNHQRPRYISGRGYLHDCSDLWSWDECCLAPHFWGQSKKRYIDLPQKTYDFYEVLSAKVRLHLPPWLQRLSMLATACTSIAPSTIWVSIWPLTFTILWVSTLSVPWYVCYQNVFVGILCGLN